MTTAVHLPDRIEHWPRSRLKRYNRNPRTHSPEQIAKLVASLQEFGWTNPILVDITTEEIIAGHGRLAGAEVLGVDPVPVIPLSHLTDAQRRAYIIADNRLALDAGWDEDLLAGELAALQDDGFDLELTGFDLDELEDLLPDDDASMPVAGADPDDVPAFEPTPVSQFGDTWLLGKHRVMCGDSTSAEMVGALLDGHLADCLWTDPPYNVNYESKAGKIANDHMDDSSFAAFLGDVYAAAFGALKPGAPAYIAHADTEGVNFRQQFVAAGFYLSGCLVWYKNALVLGRSDYHWRHEPILYGWKPGAAHTWYGDRNKTTIHDTSEGPVTRVSDTEVQISLGESVVVIRGEALDLEVAHGSVFFENKPKANAEHPTMKPVGLIERQLENSTRRGDLVLDLFGGSGSTLIACEQLGRKGRLMEMDPKFVDVTVKRWQALTGRQAMLATTGETFDDLAERYRSLEPAGATRVKGAIGIMEAGHPFDQTPANDEGDVSDVA